MTYKEKLAKLIAKIKRLYNQSLADENRQADRGLELSANVSYGKSIACKELLSFIDTFQEGHVNEDLKEAANEVQYCNGYRKAVEEAEKWLNAHAHNYIVTRRIHGVDMTGLHASFTEDFRKALEKGE